MSLARSERANNVVLAVLYPSPSKRGRGPCRRNTSEVRSRRCLLTSELVTRMIPCNNMTRQSYACSENGSPCRIFPVNFVKLAKLATISNTSFCMKSGMSIRNERGFGEEEHPSTLGDKDAVVIVDHGSRRQESNLMLNEFVAMFKSKSEYQIVEPAHMELARPSIKDAFNQCVQQGADRIIVSPFFLFPGRHWHQDIPSLAAEAAREHSGISYIVTAPLGLHELMVDVINDRIKQCLSHVTGEVGECSMCAGTGRCRFYGH